MTDKTPRGERTHIAIIGKRNAGKSSLINAITGQETAIVSDVKGTTTDPVFKAMELLPLGPVVFIDTPGIDDVGQLGSQRIDKTFEVLAKADIALFVADSYNSPNDIEMDVVKMLRQKHIPFIYVVNKSDMYNEVNVGDALAQLSESLGVKVLSVSALLDNGIVNLKEEISKIIPDKNKGCIISDYLNPSDLVVLVIPIDEAAPKGRLILPQQQTIRDIIDSNAIAVITKETEYPETLRKLGCKPKLVITDSQVFAEVNDNTDSDVFLTSFSILFARYKGNLDELIKGTEAVNKLKDGDKILIAEGCTHHRQCNDIGTVKIPRMLANKTGKNFIIETSSGNSFPRNLTNYSLIVHCGGCTLNHREMLSRIEQSKEKNIPIVNYGIFMAYCNGILERTTEIFRKQESNNYI